MAVMNKKVLAWIKIIRFQFYPMTWIAYSLGATAAAGKFENFDLNIYGIGYMMLFFVELSDDFGQ